MTMNVASPAFCRCIRRISALMLAFALAFVLNARAADGPPLVYIIVDTARPPEQRQNDSLLINRIMEQINQTYPDAQFFIHLSSAKFNFDRTVFKYNQVELRNNLIDYYLQFDTKMKEQFKTRRNLSDELAVVVTNLLQLRTKGLIDSATHVWIVAFHDMNLIDPSRTDTSCCALTDGWLSAAQSPFMRNFISKGTSPLKGARAIVFLSKPPPLLIRRAKEQFFAQLFDKAGAELDFLGFNYYEQHSGTAAFTLALMAAFEQHALQPVPHDPIGDASILQMIDEHGVVVPVNAYN